jgi:hypothetical protein
MPHQQTFETLPSLFTFTRPTTTGKNPTWLLQEMVFRVPLDGQEEAQV